MTERLSTLARGMQGSAILRIAAEVRELLAQGKPLCNHTVGDFAPAQFPVPARLARDIARHIEEGQTNYPPSNGLPELRKAVVAASESLLVNQDVASGLCGKSFGSFSKNFGS